MQRHSAADSLERSIGWHIAAGYAVAVAVAVVVAAVVVVVVAAVNVVDKVVVSLHPLIDQSS